MEHVTQWTAERDQVTAGQVKYLGRWMPAAEADRQRGRQLLEQGRSLLSQGKFDLAIQKLLPIFYMARQAELVSQAKPLLVSAYQQSFAALDHQQQQLKEDLSSARQHLEQDRQTHSDLRSAQDHLLQLERQFTVVNRRLAVLQSQTLALGIQIPAAGAPAPAAPAQSTNSAPVPSVMADAPSVLGDILSWVKTNWPALALAGLVAVYLLSRLTKD